MDEFTLILRFTERSREGSAAPIQICKMSQEQKKDSPTYEVVFSLTPDAYLLVQTCLRQSLEQLPYSQEINLFSRFISTQIDRFTRKWRQSSTEQSTPTNSTSDQRTSTSEKRIGRVLSHLRRCITCGRRKHRRTLTIGGVDSLMCGSGLNPWRGRFSKRERSNLHLVTSDDSTSFQPTNRDDYTLSKKVSIFCLKTLLRTSPSGRCAILWNGLLLRIFGRSASLGLLCMIPSLSTSDRKMHLSLVENSEGSLRLLQSDRSVGTFHIKQT